MLTTKRLCSFCTHSMLRGLCAIHASVNSEIIREYSAKKSKNGNKTTNQIRVTAKNDFVTHQLNTSISAHLKRQQKIWNDAQEKERRLQYRNKLRNDCDRDRTNHEHWTNQKAAYGTKNLGEDNGDSSDIDSDDYSLEQLETPQWERMNLVKINKKCYEPGPIAEDRPITEVNEFHTIAQVKINSDSPKPIFRFDELKHLSPKLIDAVEKRQFDQCTPIQSQSIPLALSGDNAIVISPSR